MRKVLVISTINGIAGRNELTGIFNYVNDGHDSSFFMNSAAPSKRHRRGHAANEFFRVISFMPCRSLSFRAAAMPRLLRSSPGNSRFAGFLPDSKDIQRGCPNADFLRFHLDSAAFNGGSPHFARCSSVSMRQLGNSGTSS